MTRRSPLYFTGGIPLLFLVGCGADGGDPKGDVSDGAETSDDSDDTSMSSTEATGGADSPTNVEPGPTTQPANEPAYTPCDPASRVGDFSIDLAPDYPSAAQFTSVSGAVANGIVPIQVPVVVAEDGECRLLKNQPLSCDPTCGGAETCSESGCIPYPASQNVGDVTIAGLEVEMTMTPTGRNSYSNPAIPMLPHPGFQPGSPITLDAAGGDYEPFTLYGTGIEALAVPVDSFMVNRDEPVTVTWTAASEAGPARMLLNLNLDNHGSSSARIECVTDDDGEHTIAASLISELMDQGLSGLPSLLLRRQTVDSTRISLGCVELRVVSELVLDVEVEGLISCTTADDCPDDQQCLPNLSCG